MTNLAESVAEAEQGTYEEVMHNLLYLVPSTHIKLHENLLHRIWSTTFGASQARLREGVLRHIWSATFDAPQAPERAHRSAPISTDLMQSGIDISKSRHPIVDTECESISWSIAFTPTFRKSVSNADKKLQGRVLAAIAELSETPNIVHGDTVKPLAGPFKGLWRYRLGDYRLVYEPRQEKHLIILLEFGARENVYEP